MRATLTCFILILSFNLCENYRILGLFPLPVRSHMVMFEKLMQGLAEKGHEVDVLSPFPQKTPLPRYNDISLIETLPGEDKISIPFARNTLGSCFDTMKLIIQEGGLVDSCRRVLNSTVAKELKNTKKKYDLAITEIFGSDCMLGFAYHFKVPVISITSSVNLPWGADRIGNSDNPAYIPTYFVSYTSRMSLMERVLNAVVLMVGKLWYRMSSETATTIAREFFGQDMPHLRDLAYNTSLVFVNSHFSINQARPAVPNFVEVGGLHIRPPQALSKHLENSFSVTEKYKGVIYFSMGSLLLTETLPIEKLVAFFETFKELPYKVLWKASKEEMPKNLKIPSNIQFEPWMPQLDILCNPNVKLFISHGGLLGTQESIFCGVPSLMIPFFADQELNARAAETMGYTIKIDYDDITKESVSGAILALLEDPKYRNNAERISRLFKDRPLSALETAIYWVEYVIRHNGAPHLRTVGADLPWYQYFLLDVGTILFSLLLIVVILVYYSIRCVLRVLLLKRLIIKSKNC